MGIEIREARTTQELRSVFALRGDVFVGEHIIHGDDGELLFDIHDTVAETTVLVALEGAAVVGTVRLTFDSELGVPADTFFDFRPHLPQGSRAINGSMLCVARTRRHASIGLRIVSAGFTWALEHGATHVTAAMRPRAVPVLERWGAVTVGAEFFHPIERVPVVPLLADLAKLGAPARASA